MANPELATPSEITASVPDALRAELRKQLRTEIDGETLTSPQRLALEMKYGLADPAICKEDAEFVSFMLGESLSDIVAETAEVTDVR